MGVSVDQAGEQGDVSQIDHLGPRRRCSPDPRDALALDHDERRLDDCAVRASNIRAAFSATGLAARSATSRNMKPPVRRSYHTGPEASTGTLLRIVWIVSVVRLAVELLVLGAVDGGLSTPASRLDPTARGAGTDGAVRRRAGRRSGSGRIVVDVPVGDFSFVSPLITPVLVSVLVPVPTVELPVPPVPDWPVGDPLTVPKAPVRVSSLDCRSGPPWRRSRPCFRWCSSPCPLRLSARRHPAAASAPAARNPCCVVPHAHHILLEGRTVGTARTSVNREKK